MSTMPPGGPTTRAPQWRMVQRLFGAVLGALALALALPPGPAFAHAELLSTDPVDGAVMLSAPSTVSFTFDETVSFVPDGFQLYDGSGTHFTVPAHETNETVQVTLPNDLADGSYVVGWRVVSDDSHPESGLLRFAVGHADATAPAVALADTRSASVVYGVLTALGYLGLFTLVGLTVFDLLVSRRLTAGRLLSPTAGLVAVIAYALLVPVTVIRERGTRLNDLLSTIAESDVWSGAAALTLAFAASGVVLMLLRPRLRGRPGPAVGTVGALLALASVLPVGHTRTFGPTWLIMSADIVHAGAASVWLGGLIALGLHLTRARHRHAHPAGSLVVLGRFSALAGGLVVLVGVAGTALAVVIVGSIPALFDTTYGLLLLFKIGLVVVIGGLAAWNRFWLVPRLGRRPGDDLSWRRLSHVVRWEAVGLILVVGLTSVLTMQNPRAADAAEPAPAVTGIPAPSGIPLLAELGTGHLSGQFGPGTTGTNVISFAITDAGGQSIVPLGIPQVSVAEPNLGLGPLFAEVQPGATPGSYRATVDVPAAGEWKITAAVRINELEQPAAVVDVVVVG